LSDAVRELGGEPIPFGIVPDNQERLLESLQRALEYDAILLSGGTSKGAGDLSYRAVAELGRPGIVAHGVALKPGKPLCLAVIDDGARHVPVAVLPGFPTSAIFTFHEFIAPVLRCFAGRREEAAAAVSARLPMRVNSERGRTEYLLVGLVEGQERSSLVAFPMGKGSGSVTAFSRADGFVVIPRQREYLEAGSTVEVHLLGPGVRPADLVVIGSHCTGLDFLMGELSARGFSCKVLSVGSTGGLEAAKRSECDVAGVHLLDPVSDTYNRPFLTEALELISGYGRLQGIVFRPDDRRFAGRDAFTFMPAVLADPDCMMVNRNRGSGTRVLIDRLLGSALPAGYFTEASSHNAVVAAVAQGRADWGVAIEPVAKAAGLSFLPLREEEYDFVVPKSRRGRPAVQAFMELLGNPSIRKGLAQRGFLIDTRARQP
jgi:putative molybdopterin biosynthesis protein